jgi:type IV secretion system protein VirB7
MILRLLGVLGALGFAALAGCTSTAGPFVTHISSAGPGLLRVESCEVTFSKWSNSIDVGDCTAEMVPVQPGDPRVAPATQPPPAAAAPQPTVFAPRN